MSEECRGVIRKCQVPTLLGRNTESRAADGFGGGLPRDINRDLPARDVCRTEGANSNCDPFLALVYVKAPTTQTSKRFVDSVEDFDIRCHRLELRRTCLSDTVRDATYGLSDTDVESPVWECPGRRSIQVTVTTFTTPPTGASCHDRDGNVHHLSFRCSEVSR